MDIADPVSTLRVLFLKAESLIPCLRACDTNDDHILNVTDAVYSLGFLFQAGSAPLPPFPSCGTDETVEEPLLDCVTPHCEL
jgi:hypothetical protein